MYLESRVYRPLHSFIYRRGNNCFFHLQNLKGEEKLLPFF